ncbi:hypothetical protein, partial [uncultured Granulicatella sp.]|uniref:hypothetical protein n=1 Tax=uncultured Granulicatella sp. TaxID=316089 RepID=UPI0028D3B095
MKNVDLSTFFFLFFDKIQCYGTNMEQKIKKSTVKNKILMKVKKNSLVVKRKLKCPEKISLVQVC